MSAPRLVLALTAALLLSAPASALAVGSIHGKITASSGGAPIEGLCVTVYHGNGSGQSTDVTDATGDYAVSGIPAGTRSVFVDGCGQPYLAKIVDNVTVTDGGDTEQDTTTRLLNGAITGFVTNQNGDPVANATVHAFLSTSVSSTPDDSATTNFNGGYTLDDESEFDDGNSYKLRFQRTGYTEEWYQDKATRAAADLIATAGMPRRTGINATITANAGEIRGTVTKAGSGNADGVYVYARAAGSGEITGSATTATDGTYRIQNLPVGNYKVEFNPNRGVGQPSPSGDYLGEFFDNQTTLAAATPVPVTGGGVATANAELALGQKLSGTVKDQFGTSVSGGSVVIFADTATDSPDERAQHEQSVPDASGIWDIGGLRSPLVVFGTPYTEVYVSWSPPDGSQYLGATSSEFGFPAGQDVSGINLVTTLGGTISGTVTKAGGTPFGGQAVRVYAFDNAGRMIRRAFTDSSGNFEMGRMAPGAYKLRYDQATMVSHRYEYSGGGQTLAQATPVTVTPGNTTDADAELAALNVTPPVNDDIADAIELPTGVQVFGQNVGATGEPGEAAGFDGPAASVWWKWTAPSDGTFMLEACGTDPQNSGMEIYTGTATNALTIVPGRTLISAGCQKASGNVAIRFTATSGTTYRIRMGFQYAGDLGLRVFPYDAVQPETYVQGFDAEGVGEGLGVYSPENQRGFAEGDGLKFVPGAVTRGGSGSITADSFECSLDGAAFTACTTAGVTYNGLADGQHVFRARATKGGKTDPTPYAYRFYVDAPNAACANGADDDGDTRTDYPTDRGCVRDLDVDEEDAGTVGTAPDSDGDGVIDALDNCPSVAGPESNNGCPLAPEESPTPEPTSTPTSTATPSPTPGGGTVPTPTPGPGGGGGGTPDTAVTGGTLTAKAKQKRPKKGIAISFTVAAGEPVTAAATAKAAIGKKRYSLKAKTVKVTGAPVKVKLTASSKTAKKLRAALKKRKKVKVAITVVLVDAAGNTKSLKKTVRIT